MKDQKQKKPEGMIRKLLEGFRTEETEESEQELRFLTIKTRSSRNLSNYEEAKKVARKVMEETDKFKKKKGI